MKTKDEKQYGESNVIKTSSFMRTSHKEGKTTFQMIFHAEEM
jgi:hypothetical protein